MSQEHCIFDCLEKSGDLSLLCSREFRGRKQPGNSFILCRRALFVKGSCSRNNQGDFDFGLSREKWGFASCLLKGVPRYLGCSWLVMMFWSVSMLFLSRTRLTFVHDQTSGFIILLLRTRRTVKPETQEYTGMWLCNVVKSTQNSVVDALAFESQNRVLVQISYVKLDFHNPQIPKDKNSTVTVT